MQDEDIMTGEMLVETVENQLADGNPIQVKETLMRLMMTGTPREEAIEMIACALSVEVFDVVKNGGSFDLKRYAENLSALPDMPWEFED
ncbi:hypothetical protein ABT56_05640 [Photobacterium aquae]|uniref:Uncharacterized protein n=1 Tax=Photobacterium aquae TaxID=1195763 RepID=A0A0J1H5T7_9GAMM|nr:hypothetical protein [Photobacterium aquae]KLV07046.1 hypothetical protein ABT56_05640 [Photobacterium aquae]